MFDVFDFDPDFVPLDDRLTETALACGEHSGLVLDALRTGDWSAVDALPEPRESRVAA